jgi:hypothetical protein
VAQLGAGVKDEDDRAAQRPAIERLALGGIAILVAAVFGESRWRRSRAARSFSA